MVNLREASFNIIHANISSPPIPDFRLLTPSTNIDQVATPPVPLVSPQSPTITVAPLSSDDGTDPFTILPTNTPYRLVARELQLAASPDDIPAIDFLINQ